MPRAASSLAMALTILVCSSGASPVVKLEKSPHAEALELVFSQQAEQIRQLDTRDWWLDTDERTWRVKRPFGPGHIDSTHSFNVEYLIGGQLVGQWFVD